LLKDYCEVCLQFDVAYVEIKQGPSSFPVNNSSLFSENMGYHIHSGPLKCVPVNYFTGSKKFTNVLKETRLSDPSHKTTY
jgi:hypothetical protein